MNVDIPEGSGNAGQPITLQPFDAKFTTFPTSNRGVFRARRGVVVASVYSQLSIRRPDLTQLKMENGVRADEVAL
jgi:hypothetical protein